MPYMDAFWNPLVKPVIKGTVLSFCKWKCCHHLLTFMFRPLYYFLSSVKQTNIINTAKLPKNPLLEVSSLSLFLIQSTKASLKNAAHHMSEIQQRHFRRLEIYSTWTSFMVLLWCLIAFFGAWQYKSPSILLDWITKALLKISCCCCCCFVSQKTETNTGWEQNRG